MLKIITYFSVLACTLGALNPLDNGIRAEGQDRITGGTTTSIVNFPYHVSVEYNETYICAGSVISSYYVLTAAHCIQYSVSGYTVRAGTSIRGYGGIVYNVTALTIYPGYNAQRRDSDIGLIRISSSSLIGGAVKAIALSSFPPSSGATAVVTGWQTVNDTQISRPLQYAYVTIVSNTVCMAIYGTDFITFRTICGNSVVGRVSCTEDSGGALVSGDVQVGIVSGGSNCSVANPSVYISVGSFRSWITSVTGIA